MKKLVTLFVLITPLLLNAQVQNQFSPGEIVSSSKVNANFAYLANMIGNDNVTAMMVCNASGIANEKYYYGECLSTDNQTFENNMLFTKNWINYEYNTYWDLRKNTSTSNSVEDKHNIDNCISMNDLFNNKWIIFDSQYDYVVLGAKPHFFEKHIFFKLRTD